MAQGSAESSSIFAELGREAIHGPKLARHRHESNLWWWNAFENVKNLERSQEAAPPLEATPSNGPFASFLHADFNGAHHAAPEISDVSASSARLTPRSMVSSTVTAGIRGEVRRRSSAISVIFSRAASVSASMATPRLIAASATGAGTRAAQAS